MREVFEGALKQNTTNAMSPLARLSLGNIDRNSVKILGAPLEGEPGAFAGTWTETTPVRPHTSKGSTSAGSTTTRAQWRFSTL